VSGLNNIIYRRFQCRCIYCQRLIKRELATVEHLKPKSHGGTNTRANLALACKPCNNRRGNLDIQTFFERYAIGTRSGALKLVSEAMGWGKDLGYILTGKEYKPKRMPNE